MSSPKFKFKFKTSVRLLSKREDYTYNLGTLWQEKLDVDILDGESLFMSVSLMNASTDMILVGLFPSGLLRVNDGRYVQVSLDTRLLHGQNIQLLCAGNT